jgi:hypothetical protein
LLPGQARVADVLDVLDLWKTSHHAFSPQLLQRLKAKVPEPGMPLPLLVAV